MEQIRLIMLVESRIRGDVYVRFGGEYQYDKALDT